MCPKLPNRWNQCPDFHLHGLSDNPRPVRAVIHCSNTTVKVLYNLHRDRELFICRKDYFGEHGENLDQQTAYQKSDFLSQKPWVRWKKVLCFMKLTTMTKFKKKNHILSIEQEQLTCLLPQHFSHQSVGLCSTLCHKTHEVCIWDKPMLFFLWRYSRRFPPVFANPADFTIFWVCSIWNSTLPLCPCS